ncbi:glycosyltransferase family 39 protein [Mycolicibacterium madagascariense]|uniref:glycosyltransferase family 39 protein n=1 Tax=Mycolicibacterium madagascariense TaxID=212765 RepID=UPI001FE59D2B|nr:glycosyltransferase family 39 protein [Mycolicibacterium madagascariense]
MIARWPRWGLAVLLAGTAAMYFPGLSASGYGNEFYAAAAQAGARSWSAWFFGSLDAHDFITVDKPPAALWVTGLSVRLFGVHGWAVLVPQAVMGVAAVAILFAAVRRVVPDPRLGAAAGLLAGAVLACTPAAALMFRFDDPDALLTLLLVTAAYCLARAVHGASWRWLVLVGVAVGTAFLTKLLQAFLVLPGFGLAYLLAAPTTLRTRLAHLAAALGALVVAAGWWVLIVQLIPANARPYVGGSTDDTVLDLAFGYDGFGRLQGPHASPAVASMGPPTGPRRLFLAEMGDEISWLLPAALFALAFGGWLALRGHLGRAERAATVSWGGWLLVTGAVFAGVHGTIHPYYTVALAPAVGALVGLGSAWAWRLRATWDGRVGLAGLVLTGGWWSSILLRRNDFGPHWLPPLLLVATVAAAACAIIGRRLLPVAAGVGAAAALAGTVAFSVATAATPHHGAIPVAVAPAGRRTVTDGWLGDEGTNPALAAMLRASPSEWSAATTGSQSAAALELSSQTAVMAVGGWSDDPVPTLAQFVADVQSGRIGYYVEPGLGGAARPHGRIIRSANHSASHARDIADWVAAHYPAVSVGTSLVYRLR